MVIKRGVDLTPQQPPVPLPQIDDTTPPKVRAMVALLLKHQEQLASDRTRTIVIQASAGGQLALKVTFDL